ncbi:5-(carboxyamino)imidazole ribonucleotide mutase [Sulfurospirillum sp. T05]|uniref:N5-carboxyaminoimidazole ribonucleotide mutase n=1 Tax=Sulfurospirillum tamanense TaxID=2813362 RepID=A0ABS2WTC8_9BACT|nr:5-(carboxyamino)imidazole ribonucleotide mutase [Sulfurospirillum tamanensis]MBN2964850.1 5-(carboxyamino)imidazole ribonucleotide mutase [Sulfurospirillum tamanensis]
MRFVSILMPSKSNMDVMSECAKTLEKFGVKHEVLITSAHRSLERTQAYVKEAESRGAQLFIVGAGMAAHLAGVVAALTTRPVIGVPLNTSPLHGVDALLSTVQMPSGIPVGVMAIGSAGATNSAFLAMQILALEDAELDAKLKEDRILKAKKVEVDSEDIEVRLL